MGGETSAAWRTMIGAATGAEIEERHRASI
jgi:hypothetical protein